jgi:hypothetical protein
VKVEEADRILHRIQKRYDRNPNDDWHILWGRDPAGRLTQLIGDSRDSWQIKGEMINPLRFAGVGISLPDIGSGDIIDIAEPYYGIRTMERTSLEEMLHYEPSDLIRELMRLPRSPMKEARSADALIQGPILHSRSPITPISDRQKRLEISLDRGLENLLRRKHPETRYAYG